MGRTIAFLCSVFSIGILTAFPAVGGVAGTANGTAVAKVNGKVLFMDQLEPIIRVQQKKLPHRGPANAEFEKTAQRRAIEQLIDVELLSQNAQGMEIADLEAKIDEKITGLRHTRPAMFTENSEAEIRKQLTDELCVEAYLREKGLVNPDIPEAEIRALYDKGRESFRKEESVRLRHISIQLSASSTAAQKARAREILQLARQRIVAGAAFESAAEEALSDPDGSQGDLGLLTRRDMPEEIANAAFSLAPGSISEVIDTPSGIHLVGVLERQPAGVIPYEGMREILRKYLQEVRGRQAYQKLFQSLRQQAEIEILLGPG